MKLVIAVVRPFILEKVLVALEDIEGFPGMTVVDSVGSKRRLNTDLYDVLEPFQPGKRIEIAANDEMVERIVAAIKESAHTGKKGDGIITVLHIDEAVGI